MTSALFLGFVAIVAAAVIGVATWHLPRTTASRIAAVLLAWLLYVGLLSWNGVVASPTLRPPGIVYVLGPIAAFVLFGVLRSSAALRIASAVPLWVPIAFQSYRVGVELFLHRLWVEQLVPKMLTFEGANVDILIGASAVAAAWSAMRGRRGLRIAFAWNVLGLVALANVVVRSALTSPGPLHLLATDVANRAIGTFPYTYIAGFLAPLAAVLHLLSLRSIVRRLRDASPDAHGTTDPSVDPSPFVPMPRARSTARRPSFPSGRSA